MAHLRILPHIEIVNILDCRRQRIGLLVKQLAPFPLQMHVIFVIFQPIALGQVLFQDRDDFRRFGFEEMQRFDKSFDESVDVSSLALM